MCEYTCMYASYVVQYFTDGEELLSEKRQNARVQYDSYDRAEK